ncbi:MAG: M48 family metallopeptidase [Chromatiales bacterium]|nr:M48 family metallopeptidase [Chromatiales bacterium]
MTDFFARQAEARRTSRRLVLLFALALVAVLVAVNAIVLVASGLFLAPEPGSDVAAGQLRLVFWISLLVTGLVLAGSLARLRTLSSGGGAVARALGGERVTADTRDALRRRLLNVVEEMAIASGVPVPEVYVLEHEDAINAFAAGHNPANAAVAVTRGALEQLDRDELQGVIAHEFSHILNGDMRLNMRLIGLLYGLLMVAIAAELMFHGFARSRRAVRVPAGRRDGGGAAAIAVLLVVAMAIWLVGRIGVFFGRLIQAAVSRERERLADASALQFTRQPHGLKGALVKIATIPGGSRIGVPDREQVAHMLFAAGRRRGFATHPPLAERIRALDPGFDPATLDRLRAERIAEGLRRPAATSAEAPVASAAGSPAAPVPVPVQPGALVGRIDPATLLLAAQLRAGVPEALHRASAEADSAAGLLLALVLDPVPELAQRQVEEIRCRLGDTRADGVAGWADALRALPREERLPTLQMQFASLHHWPRRQREQLVECLAALPRPGEADVTAWVLGRLSQVWLIDELDPDGAPWELALDQVDAELGVLFAVLAHHGNPDPAAARRSYEMGLSRLLPRERPAYAPPADWAPTLDVALARLDRLSAPARELLLDALVQTIQHDGQLTLAEAELLRAVCAVLHCPLPPLNGAGIAPAGPA